MTKTKIMYDSPAAAQRKTVTGWVSRDGLFFGDSERGEHMARWSGCTHKLCECGREMEKSWIRCEECREQSRKEKYLAMETKEHKGEPLYSDSSNEYFFDLDDLHDHCFNRDITTSDLDLIICDPVYAEPVEDYWVDELPDGMDLEGVSQALAEAVGKLNDFIAEEKIILSWRPGKYRTSIRPQE